MDYLDRSDAEARLADIITRHPGNGYVRAALGPLLARSHQDIGDPLQIAPDETDEQLLVRLCGDHPVPAVFAHLGGGGDL